MASTISSNAVSMVYKSRKTILEFLQAANYDVEGYLDFNIIEINTMVQNKQLDMLIEEKEVFDNNAQKRKMYIKYHNLDKSIRPPDIPNYVEDLFEIENVLSKEDTLVIIVKEEPNESIQNTVKQLFDKDGIYVVVFSIARLQFNILNHVLVPTHKIITTQEKEELYARYTIKQNSELPEISRFDPVANAIFLRPGQICEILRDSKTAYKTKYYRICV